jgi:arabinan endo-1,5-alpha-L-arabinosidase
MPSAIVDAARDANVPVFDASGGAAPDASVGAVPDARTAGEEDAGPVDAGLSSSPADAGHARAAGAHDAGGTQDGACAPDLDPQHEPQRLELSGAVQLSDPALIESRETPGTFYVFASGPGIRVRSSTDLRAWQDAGQVFLFDPPWIAAMLDAGSELWSPDVSFFGGVYHLYYAVSKQGNNRSCIGHATSRTLPGPFEDRGSVLCSSLGAQRDNWNAIHPNYVEDE